MDSQNLNSWNRANPVGTPVLAKLPAGDPRTNPLPTKTRSTAYIADEKAWVMVSGISTPVALDDVSWAKTGRRFPIQLTTAFYDQDHLQALLNAVTSINAEGVDLNIEDVEKDGDGSGWVTISASTANRFFHLGARMGKWAADEQKAEPEL